MTPQEKMSALWHRIPRKLFGGRMRTTTVVMCVLWLGLAMLNAQLTESRSTTDSTVQTGVQRDEDPYRAPVVESSPQTSTSATPSETATSSSTTTPPSSSDTTRPSGPTTTTTVPGGAGKTTERTTDRQTTTSESAQQSQEPTGTTSATESTTNPSPGG